MAPPGYGIYYKVYTKTKKLTALASTSTFNVETSGALLHDEPQLVLSASMPSFRLVAAVPRAVALSLTYVRLVLRSIMAVAIASTSVIRI